MGVPPGDTPPGTPLRAGTDTRASAALRDARNCAAGHGESRTRGPVRGAYFDGRSATDGTGLATVVGSAGAGLGAVAGRSFGTTVGTGLGTVVGAAGTGLGSDGPADGTVLGTGDGTAEGAVEGAADGTGDGGVEGADVGDGVAASASAAQPPTAAAVPARTPIRRRRVGRMARRFVKAAPLSVGRLRERSTARVPGRVARTGAESFPAGRATSWSVPPYL
ncbi:hypothetical protein M2164_002976 [Streptomyces sp. SAI-208]|nr:hypothetical protein [Streptomyces sp. SAI-208]